MLEIIILLIICAIVWNLLKGLVKFLMKAILVILGIVLYIKFLNITVPATIFIVLSILFIMGIRKIHKEVSRIMIKKNNKKWINSYNGIYTAYEEDILLKPLLLDIFNADTNTLDYKFIDSKIPYGRVNAFLNYFGESIYTDEPYYFSCIPSKDESEFREYGLLITRKGVYISQQGKENLKLPFAGLKNIKNDDHIIYAYVVSKTFDV